MVGTLRFIVHKLLSCAPNDLYSTYNFLQQLVEHLEQQLFGMEP